MRTKRTMETLASRAKGKNSLYILTCIAPTSATNQQDVVKKARLFAEVDTATDKLPIEYQVGTVIVKSSIAPEKVFTATEVQGVLADLGLVGPHADRYLEDPDQMVATEHYSTVVGMLQAAKQGI